MIYLFLAEGFEEVEALVPLDLLRRCEKEVVSVGIGETLITGAHGITVAADITEHELVLSDEIEMIILPGGMPGTLGLQKNSVVHEAIDYCTKRGIYIAAICAAPSILGQKGLLDGREAVCYPGFEAQLTGARISERPVVQDGHIITARGAGVAMQFSLKLAELLCGADKARALSDALQYEK